MTKFLSCMLIFFFICGSFTSIFSHVSAAELVENSWNTKTPMSQPRAGLGIVAVDGKIYAIGGYTTFDDDSFVASGVVGTNECYDPVADTWVTLASMPTPRHNFAITEYQGKIYCIGGYINERNTYGFSMVSFDTNEVYDPTTNSWSTKAPCPFYLSVDLSESLEAVVVDGKIFVFTCGTELFMYDPIKDTWTQKSNMPHTKLLYFAPVVMDNKILFTSMYLTTMVYDPQTNMWSEKEQESQLIPLFSVDFSTVVTTGVYAPQTIYIIGQQSGTTLVNYAYDPVNSIRTSVKPPPIYRADFGITVVNDILYMIGGNIYHDDTDSEILSLNQQYVPLGYSKATSSTDSINLNTLILIVAIAAVIIVILVGIFVFYSKKSLTHYKRSYKKLKQDEQADIFDLLHL